MVKQARGPTSKSILPRSIRLEKKKKNGNQQEPCCSCINIFQVSPPCFMVMRTPLCICILLLSRSTSAGSVIDEELPTDVDSTSSSSSKKFATNGNTIVRSDTRSRDSNVPALFPHDPFQSPLELLLFPNRTKHYDEHGQIIYVDENNRALSYGTDTYTDDIAKQLQCAICAGLTACTALNTLLIQEVYYPIPGSSKDPGELGGTCQILDERGQRFASNVEGNDESIFGPDNTFRDTPTCRDLVLQYLCLWWGSDNGMYTNFCVYQVHSQLILFEYSCMYSTSSNTPLTSHFATYRKMYPILIQPNTKLPLDPPVDRSVFKVCLSVKHATICLFPPPFFIHIP